MTPSLLRLLHFRCGQRIALNIKISAILQAWNSTAIIGVQAVSIIQTETFPLTREAVRRGQRTFSLQLAQIIQKVLVNPKAKGN